MSTMHRISTKAPRCNITWSGSAACCLQWSYWFCWTKSCGVSHTKLDEYSGDLHNCSKIWTLTIKFASWKRLPVLWYYLQKGLPPMPKFLFATFIAVVDFTSSLERPRGLYCANCFHWRTYPPTPGTRAHPPGRACLELPMWIGLKG